MNILKPHSNTDPKQKGTRPVPKGSLAHQLSSDPFLDWVLILAIALVTALALVGVGTSVYLGTRTSLTGSEVIAPSRAAMPIDEALLDKVLNGFDKRAEERAAVLRNYAAPADPSLP